MKYDLNHCTNLLKERKLILICDLDDTLISSIYLDDNYSNSNFDESIVVASTETQINNKHIHIKLRPYLTDFLEKMSKIFELHLMSTGKEIHVKRCLDVIDPSRKYFGDRIISRENIVKSKNKAKTKEEMFDGCSNIIICLDDNLDVWNHSPTVINIKPLNYFYSLKLIKRRFANKERLKIYIKDYFGCLEMHSEDNNLLTLQSLLKEYHEDFFKVFDEGNSDKTRIMLPDIGQIMGYPRNAIKI